jgi:hypothetical protein
MSTTKLTTPGAVRPDQSLKSRIVEGSSDSSDLFLKGAAELQECCVSPNRPGIRTQSGLGGFTPGGERRKLPLKPLCNDVQGISSLSRPCPIFECRHRVVA